MALTQASLSSKIQAELVSKFGTAEDAAQLAKFADAVAKAVVDEIKINAVIAVTSVSGVTTGAGTSGPGTGTIT